MLFKKKTGGILKTGRGFCSVVVPAAGSSSRMEGVDKIFAELDGVPVLVRTVMALSKCKSVSEIIVVTRREDIPRTAMIFAQYGLSKVTRLTHGGDTRAESVMNGINEVSKKAKVIAIHDGARPFVTPEIVEEVIKTAAEYNAAVPAVQVKDTVKTVKNGKVVSTPDRSELYAVQTPQAFDADLIRGAMKNAADRKLSITDDSMAAEAIGGEVRIVPGSYENIKITTPEDMVIGEAILKRRKETE